MMFWNFADKYPGYATIIILVISIVSTIIMMGVIGIIRSIVSPSPPTINTCNYDDEDDEDEDEDEDEDGEESSMIIGCYTLELYCNGDSNCRFTLSKDDGPNESATFTGETAGQAHTRARKAGWKLNIKDGIAICPDCRKKFS